MLLLAFTLSWLSGAAVTPLSIRPHPVPGLHIGDAVIVGRARCAGRIWLLTNDPALVEVALQPPGAVHRVVKGLHAREEPWGLACTNGSDLWTMVSPHELARVDLEGRIGQRIGRTFPMLAVFGHRDALITEQLPLVAGTSALAENQPGARLVRGPWRGLVVRDAPSPAERLTRNLVACGVSGGAALPCWFADSDAVVVSNGRTSRTVSIQGLGDSAVDRLAPIRDVATVPEGLWVLATRAAALGGRLTGGRVLLTGFDGVVHRRIDLVPPARLIVDALPGVCWLLGADDRLLEVSVR